MTHFSTARYFIASAMLLTAVGCAPSTPGAVKAGEGADTPKGETLCAVIAEERRLLKAEVRHLRDLVNALISDSHGPRVEGQDRRITRSDLDRPLIEERWLSEAEARLNALEEWAADEGCR